MKLVAQANAAPDRGADADGAAPSRKPANPRFPDFRRSKGRAN